LRLTRTRKSAPQDSGAIAIRICSQDIKNALSDADDCLQAGGVYRSAKILDSKLVSLADGADSSPIISTMNDIVAALAKIDKIGDILAHVTPSVLPLSLSSLIPATQIHPWVKLAYTAISSVYKVHPSDQPSVGLLIVDRQLNPS
jgi:hypothetical protein